MSIAYVNGKPTREYRSWQMMWERCRNPKMDNYKYYGGRGITICDRWKNFSSFYEDMGPRPDGMSLDRIDDNGNYCPENCKWSTHKSQCRNRRSNRLLEYKGQLLTMTEVAETCGLRFHTLRKRIVDLGWSVERATTEPLSV